MRGAAHALQAVLRVGLCGGRGERNSELLLSSPRCSPDPAFLRPPPHLAFQRVEHAEAEAEGEGAGDSRVNGRLEDGGGEEEGGCWQAGTRPS